MDAEEPATPRRTGDLVVARGVVWQVLEIEEGEDCRAVRLACVHPTPTGRPQTLIEPFDTLRPLPRQTTPRVVARAAALSAVSEVVGGDRAWHEPLAAAGARVDLLDWQLVPSIALLSGATRRLLVADAVGLGKTIQAGILVGELRARRAGARVLLLVPAGLRLQWQDELRRRFDVAAEIVDLDWLDREARGLPPGVNPWARAPVVITSLDFAKRHEILPGPDGLAWDLVVIDEAHGIGTGTARADLAGAVSRRAARVLMLTATPHDGSDARFEALRRLGAVPGEPDWIQVRRSRGEAGVDDTSRRWRILRAPSTPDDAHLRGLLDRYGERLLRSDAAGPREAMALLVQVLRKRAASSTVALARTVERRRALLDARGDLPAQPLLPLAGSTADADERDDEVLSVPGLASGRSERAWLGVLAEVARRAARSDTKTGLVRRWLRRAREPVIVFTEYRATLSHLVHQLRDTGPLDVLHGGMSAAERRTTVERFAAGATRVLLATDAAREGLNLHHRCRAVVLFDLPWTPGRLEQRIGRVDRLGQPRRVHVLALLRSDDAFDRELLARLSARRQHIETALASDVAGREAAAGRAGRAAVACTRLRLRRSVLRAHTSRRGRAPDASRAGRLLVTCLRPARHPREWSGVLAIVDAEMAGGACVVDRATVAYHLPVPVPPLHTRAAVEAFVARWREPVENELLRRARRHVAERWRVSQEECAAFDRLALLARASAGTRPPGSTSAQPSLFGRYAEGAVRPRELSPEGCAERADAQAVRLSERLALAVLLLKPGPGRWSAAVPPAS
jgi:superfamily II DNA or RNA helicase